MAVATKVGSEFLVNTETLGQQISSTVATFSDGSFVIVWTDSSGTLGDASADAVKGQIYNATGTKVGSEFLVNTETTNFQSYAEVTTLANGNFVVTWRDTSGTLGDTFGTSVKAQLFSGSGAKVGSEFLVNTETDSNQANSSNPAITELAGGNYVITWDDGSRTLGDADTSSIKAQIFSAAGAKVGSEFLVNTQTLSGQYTPDIAALDNGNFVVTWYDISGTLGNASEASVKAQIFSATGGKVGSEFLVNTETASAQSRPRITGLANGDFVVTWFDYSGTLGDASDTSIKAQVFSAAGAKKGGEFLVNTEAANGQYDPSVTGLSSGGFVITWYDTSQTLGDGELASIKAQLFAADGTKQGGEFLVNSEVASSQLSPTIAGTPGGGFVVTWTDYSKTLGDTSGASIKAQLFTVDADAPDVNGTTEVDNLRGTAAAEKLYGLGGNDRLTALAGNDLLDGGAGNDTMRGGIGNDTYVVDAAGDTVSEKAGEGNDTVQTALAKYVLGTNVENLTFSGNAAHLGIGNALGNTITGGGGNDRLDGRAGADTLQGGAGNDIYVLDQSGDRAIEAAGGGIDTVYAGFSAVTALGDNIENLKLTGTGAFFGYGNAANNTLTGNSGDNTLSSATGNDLLNGLGGNDTLYGGFDNDVLSGGDGDDKLYGGIGRDVMTGGAGADRFLFDSAPDSRLNFDKITDFASGTDKLILSKGTFTGFAVGGPLAEGAFQSGAGLTTAKDADDRLIYNTTNGKLYYDADGSDAASGAVLVAILIGHPALAFSDVLISA